MVPIVDSSSEKGNNNYAEMRRKMVENQIINRGIQNKRVIQAMLGVPRHLFAPQKLRGYSYNDNPIPIALAQTMSQPYIVALMTELLNPGPGKKILEIGTGSGYQTAVLGETRCELYTVEILEEIAVEARSLLQKIGYNNIEYKIGDGYMGGANTLPMMEL